jgi:leader peptidase (prepilin peptidase)/N-methyltransferase
MSMATGASGSRPRLAWPWWAPVTGLALAGGTFARDGVSANALCFAVVQILLVALAAVDLATHRLPNVITLPTSLAAIVLRAAFERSALEHAVFAGVGALLIFGLLAVLLRGGLGMGDVKLAGMLGFVLAWAAVPALVVGILAGGLGSLALLAFGRARWTSAIAYGPYLAFGGALAILAFHYPPLV